MHLSDPHFGALNEITLLDLHKAVKRLNPTTIIVTGDITQRCRRDQFVRARNYFSEFHPIPVLAIPGNHDLPLYNLFSRFFTPYREYKRFFRKEIECELRTDSIHLIALNSSSPRRHIDGEFNLRHLEEKLKGLDPNAKVKIVAFHHPLDCPKHVDEKNIVRNCLRVLELLEEYKVDLVLSGHIHDPLARLSTVRYSQARKPMILSNAGTCLSYRIRPNAPNSFNVFDFYISNQLKVQISRYDLTPAHGFQFHSNCDFIRNNDPTSVWAPA